MNENCILFTDFRIVDQYMKDWENRVMKRENIHHIFLECIEFLGISLEHNKLVYNF